MSRLAGRVAIVTGAGRGLGRAHALHFAAEGAAVVVNDRGGSVHGEGADDTPAAEVVREIKRAGGRAVSSNHDVSNWDQAEQLVRLAVEEYGALHVLVNNAGILRDRTLANMSEDEWDAVIRVHLKGHAAPTRHALAYWRDCAKSGEPLRASVIHTTSVAGFAGNFGQANYSAAKSAVLGLSQVVALEGAKYGVRSNAVSPSARTRITAASNAGLQGNTRMVGGRDELDPTHVSPLIGWLAEETCPASAQVFHVYGGRLLVIGMPRAVHDIRTENLWTAAAIEKQLSDTLLRSPTLDEFLPERQS